MHMAMNVNRDPSKAVGGHGTPNRVHQSLLFPHSDPNLKPTVANHFRGVP